MNYYNENDPKAAAWLRELIKNGLIAPGEVDERSISDVLPADLIGFKQCHFFAGIGGWSYALRLAGISDDAEIWTGSCPCQPWSNAGEGGGEDDPRHLWPKWSPLIQECRPPIIFGEQVASKTALRWLDGVFTDLENADYACAAADLCAAGINAPHIRQRLFWVANSDGWNAGPEWEQRGRELRLLEEGSVIDGLGHADGARRKIGTWIAGNDVATIDAGPGEAVIETGFRGDAFGVGNSALSQGPRLGQQREQLHGSSAWSAFEAIQCSDGKARRIEPGTFPLAHGVSGRVGLLRGYGNAIVPQEAAEFIAAAFESIHERRAA